MERTVTPRGLLVGLAVFGVIVYELRTVLDMFGVSVPLLPYLAGVAIAAVAVAVAAFASGRLRYGGADD